MGVDFLTTISTYLSVALYLTGTYPDIEQKLFWEAKNIEVSSWRKVVLELPNDVDEYQILFEGEYNKTASYYSRNYVTIDDLELRSCSHQGKVLLQLPCCPLYGLISHLYLLFSVSG